METLKKVHKLLVSASNGADAGLRNNQGYAKSSNLFNAMIEDAANQEKELRLTNNHKKRGGGRSSKGGGHKRAKKGNKNDRDRSQLHK